MAELDAERQGAYFPAQSEKDPRRLCQFLLPADLGIPISLMDLEPYDKPQGSKPEIAEADKKILAVRFGGGGEMGVMY